MSGAKGHGPKAGGSALERALAQRYVPQTEKGVLADEEVIVHEIVDADAINMGFKLPWAKTGLPLPDGSVWRPDTRGSNAIWAIRYGVEFPGEGFPNLGQAASIAKNSDPKQVLEITVQVMRLTFGGEKELADLKNGGDQTEETDGKAYSEYAALLSTVTPENLPPEG